MCAFLLPRKLAALAIGGLLGITSLADAQTSNGYLDATNHPTDLIAVTLANDGSLNLEISVGPNLNLNSHPGIGISEGVIVYDSTGTNRLYGALQGQNSTVTHVVTGLGAGNYTVRLTAIGDFPGLGWGSYSMTASETPDPLPNDTEPNDDFDHALTAPLNVEVVGHLGYKGAQSVIEKQDYWKVSLPSDGTLELDIVTGTLLNLNANDSVGATGGVMVYDADRTTIFHSAAQGQNTSATHSIPKLKAGTYYVRLVVIGYVSGFFGSYRMTARHTPETMANDAEPNDQAAQHGVLTLDNPVTGHLGYYGGGAGASTDAQDWWRVTLPHAGTLELEVGTSPLLNLNVNASVGANSGITVFDNDATTVLFGAVQAQNTTNTHQALRLKPGVYYVRLTRIDFPDYYGGYRLTPRLVPVAEDPEPNDDAAHAGLAVLGSTVNGNLGYRGGGSGLTTDAVDWWIFTLPSTGQVQFVITTFGNLNLNANAGVGASAGITLFSTTAGGGLEGEIPVANQGGDGNAQAYSRNLAAGDYYLRLAKLDQDAYWGAYSATMNYVGAPAITSPATAKGLTGQPFNYTITALGGVAFGASGLPAELSVNAASGLISGTLGQPGTHNVVLLATNANGPASAPLTLTVLALPTLTLQSSAPNQVVITWPADYSDFSLKTATNFDAGATWEPATPAPVVIGNTFAVTNLVEQTPRYYRLKQE